MSHFLVHVIIFPMNSSPSNNNRKQYWLNLTLAVVAGQVGCVTLLIVLGALFGGLWLDNHFQTRPTITLIMVLASVPVSLASMLLIVRSATKKIKINQSKNAENAEGADVGKNT